MPPHWNVKRLLYEDDHVNHHAMFESKVYQHAIRLCRRRSQTRVLSLQIGVLVSEVTLFLSS